MDEVDADGLIAVGGQLSVDWLVDAYSHGIFPWPLWDDTLAWWSPDPRAVFEFDRFHVSKRLERTCRSGRFEVTSDRDFAAVIHGCATAQDRIGQTWLTAPMQQAYLELHSAGYAHSVEVWSEGELAGGTYGVSLGGVFSAESKFHYQRDASKVALVHLVNHLRSQRYQLLDIQQLTPHTARMGAVEIPRGDFLSRLDGALRCSTLFGDIST